MPHRRPARVLPLVCSATAVVAGLFLGPTPGPFAGTTRLSVTGGIHSPTGGDEREVFGIAPQFGLGIATDFADGASTIGLDIGYVRSSGSETFDPTFDIPESHYTLVPITVSLTTRLAGGSRESWPRIFFGAFATVMPTEYTNRNDDSYSSPTVGAGLELRPEFHLADDWRMFGRTRIGLVDGVDYRGSSADINYSALTLELGVSTGLH